jgi:hypothetical protein
MLVADAANVANVANVVANAEIKLFNPLMQN